MDTTSRATHEVSPRDKRDEAFPVIGGTSAPPVPRYQRKRDYSRTVVLLVTLLFMVGWWLLAYLEVHCLGFDVRDIMPRQRPAGVQYSSPAVQIKSTAFNTTTRDIDARDVATEAKNSVREFFGSAGNFQCPQPHRFTQDEVARHHTADDMWIVIDGNVLDLSSFVHQHPGGLVLLDGAGGQDMATVFARFHHPSSVGLFSSFCIGRIVGL